MSERRARYLLVLVLVVVLDLDLDPLFEDEDDLSVRGEGGLQARLGICIDFEVTRQRLVPISHS